jgi:hypothetical protein
LEGWGAFLYLLRFADISSFSERPPDCGINNLLLLSDRATDKKNGKAKAAERNDR